ncbi:hypothetical protein Tco_1513733 [Tanacetum coccineum]
MDALSKIASTSFAHLTKQVLVEVLKEKSNEEKGILKVVEEEGHFWMTPLLEYLMDGILPAETKKGAGHKNQIQTICHNRWCLVPQVIPRTVATMRLSALGRLRHKGNL